jgi:hypothetical protein
VSARSDDGWGEYLAAAQRLDAARRRAAGAARDQAEAFQAAREELAKVRARLAPQRSWLRDQGVPESDLLPVPTEVVAATDGMAGDPAAVLAALRQAGATADAADAAAQGGQEAVTRIAERSADWRLAAGTPAVALRNLLVYGPFALVVLVVLLALYLTADQGALLPSVLLCALLMPAAAFGLGWVTIGLVFPAGAGGKVERTPLLGVLVCASPLVTACVGAGALAVLR